MHRGTSLHTDAVSVHLRPLPHSGPSPIRLPKACIAVRPISNPSQHLHKPRIQRSNARVLGSVGDDVWRSRNILFMLESKYSSTKQRDDDDLPYTVPTPPPRTDPRSPNHRNPRPSFNHRLVKSKSYFQEPVYSLILLQIHLIQPQPTVPPSSSRERTDPIASLVKDTLD